MAAKGDDIDPELRLLNGKSMTYSYGQMRMPIGAMEKAASSSE